MISERQASSKTSTSFNPVTGDSLTSKVGSQEAYASGWDLIWGKKEPEKIILSPEDTEQFINLIENSPEPNGTLKRAFSEYKSKNIVEQHFLQEQLPENIIGDEL